MCERWSRKVGSRQIGGTNTYGTSRRPHKRGRKSLPVEEVNKVANRVYDGGDHYRSEERTRQEGRPSPRGRQKELEDP